MKEPKKLRLVDIVRQAEEDVVEKHSVRRSKEVVRLLVKELNLRSGTDPFEEGDTKNMDVLLLHSCNDDRTPCRYTDNIRF